jgi:hypothetical protein
LLTVGAWANTVPMVNVIDPVFVWYVPVHWYAHVCAEFGSVNEHIVVSAAVSVTGAVILHTGCNVIVPKLVTSVDAEVPTTPSAAELTAPLALFVDDQNIDPRLLSVIPVPAVDQQAVSFALLWLKHTLAEALE